MVVISAPAARDTGKRQERVGVPFTCTVHAPHCPMPQPNFVPLRSRTSRSTQSSGMSGATSTVVDFPLTLNVNVMCSRGSVRPKSTVPVDYFFRTYFFNARGPTSAP